MIKLIFNNVYFSYDKSNYLRLMKIEIISGSPRKGSVSKRVAFHLLERFKNEAGVEVGLIAMDEVEFPFIQKVWTQVSDAPEHLQPIAGRMFNADAYVIVTPEYNGGYSPAMKNLFDHFPKRTGKTFAICSASDGALGGMRAAQQTIQLVAALFGILSPILLVTPQMDKKFDENGTLLDENFQKAIDNFILNFLDLAKKIK